MSASSWGCELKCSCLAYILRGFARQPPREAVSWNIVNFANLLIPICQPPREAVSWNIPFQIVLIVVPIVSLLVRLWVEMNIVCNDLWVYLCQPPREAVSWNMKGMVQQSEPESQPPREAVSWNCWKYNTYPPNSCQPPREAVSWNKDSYTVGRKCYTSASSWGCELKCLC